MKDAVIYAFWLRDPSQLNYYLNPLQEYFKDCDFYIGINNKEVEYKDILYKRIPNIVSLNYVNPSITVDSDASSYQAALKGYKENKKEEYRHIYFIHNKNASHPDWNTQSNHYLHHFLRGKKDLFERLLENEECGGVSNWGELNDSMKSWSKMLAKYYNFKYDCLDIMWLCTFYIIKAKLVDEFIFNCKESFFTDKLDRYFFEASFATLIERQGYLRYTHNWWERSIRYTDEGLKDAIKKWKDAINNIKT